MKAIVCRQFGPPSSLRFEDVSASPADPAPGEALVAVEAAGVGYPDLLSVAGTYPIPSQPPFIPGIEGCGRVLSVGPGVERLRPGDRVCWQDNRLKSSFAGAITLPAQVLARVPEGVSATTAAAVPTNYGTARFALHHRARVQAGETVVVHGASGGVGIAAVQLARAAGATVIATSGRASTTKAILGAGAHHVLDSGGDLRQEVRDLTGGRGADVVVDPVGGALFEASVRLLAPYGRLLVIGFTSGDFGVAKSNILLVKALSVIGVNYGHYLAEEPEAARREVEAVLDLVAAGTLAPLVQEVLPLARAAEALARLERREVTGKLVLSVADG